MSIFEKKIHPYQQAIGVFAFAVTFMGLGWALKRIGLFDTEPLFSWAIATAFLLLFGIINSLFSFNADRRLMYWRNSIYTFLGLAIANGMAAWGISGVPVNEAQSYKFIYVVVTIGFLVFISMVNAMRSIVEFAQKEEWNEPRKRR